MKVLTKRIPSFRFLALRRRSRSWSWRSRARGTFAIHATPLRPLTARYCQPLRTRVCYDLQSHDMKRWTVDSPDGAPDAASPHNGEDRHAPKRTRRDAMPAREEAPGERVEDGRGGSADVEVGGSHVGHGSPAAQAQQDEHSTGVATDTLGDSAASWAHPLGSASLASLASLLPSGSVAAPAHAQWVANGNHIPPELLRPVEDVIRENAYLRMRVVELTQALYVRDVRVSVGPPHAPAHCCSR